MYKFFRNAAPYFALAVGVLVLSLSAFFIRWAEAPGTITSFYRMLSASIILLPIYSVKESFRINLSWKILLFPALAGFFSAMDHSLWSTALGMTRVANATLFNNMAPVWVALVSIIIFRQKLRGKFWFGLTLTLIGAVVVFGDNLLKNPTLSTGDGISILSSVFYAGFFLAVQRGRQRMATLSFTFYEVVFCAVSLFLVNLFVGNSFGGYSIQSYLIFILAGLFPQVIGYFSITYALGHVPAAIVAPTMISQPILTALLAIPFLGENLSIAQWVGGITVLMGIYFVNRSQERNTHT